MIYRDHIESPIGLVEFTASDKGLTSLYFVDQTQSVESNSITAKAAIQLEQYFQGQRKTFELPLEATGTEFQKDVWAKLMDIAYGQTQSYLNVANSINKPKAVRAVGAANGQNPISIIVPCHRVIGANGQLTGYAGGVERKAWLLQHEGALLF